MTKLGDFGMAHGVGRRPGGQRHRAGRHAVLHGAGDLARRGGQRRPPTSTRSAPPTSTCSPGGRRSSAPTWPRSSGPTSPRPIPDPRELVPGLPASCAVAGDARAGQEPGRPPALGAGADVGGAPRPPGAGRRPATPTAPAEDPAAPPARPPAAPAARPAPRAARRWRERLQFSGPLRPVRPGRGALPGRAARRRPPPAPRPRRGRRHRRWSRSPGRPAAAAPRCSGSWPATSPPPAPGWCSLADGAGRDDGRTALQRLCRAAGVPDEGPTRIDGLLHRLGEERGRPVPLLIVDGLDGRAELDDRTSRRWPSAALWSRTFKLVVAGSAGLGARLWGETPPGAGGARRRAAGPDARRRPGRPLPALLARGQPARRTRRPSTSRPTPCSSWPTARAAAPASSTSSPGTCWPWPRRPVDPPSPRGTPGPPASTPPGPRPGRPRPWSRRRPGGPPPEARAVIDALPPGAPGCRPGRPERGAMTWQGYALVIRTLFHRGTRPAPRPPIT